MKTRGTSKKGTRNVWCPNYSNCLDDCLSAGKGGFSCHGCEYQDDYSGAPQDQAELAEDCRGCMALLLAAYQDLKPSQARSRASGL
ncbi:hypothetical protein [Desulforapulum autotrophicum]|uniref:hypothetical protein n=1 Tax=Desulforapulum autotrophicum TaxID=2296 RepID=UPI0002F47327|nr:hypothetical protein [Desulforapulum autotrophicum]